MYELAGVQGSRTLRAHRRMHASGVEVREAHRDPSTPPIIRHVEGGGSRVHSRLRLRGANRLSVGGVFSVSVSDDASDECEWCTTRCRGRWCDHLELFDILNQVQNDNYLAFGSLSSSGSPILNLHPLGSYSIRLYSCEFSQTKRPWLCSQGLLSI